MPEYRIELRGLTPDGTGLPGHIMRHLLATIDDGNRGAVRLRLEGRSSAKGAAPSWLDSAAAFDVVDLLATVSGIALRAPTLRETLPERFAQAEIFPVVDPDKSAVALLLESLGSALRGEADSDLYDEALLRVFERFGSLFDRGVEAIEISNQRQETAVYVEPSALETFQHLRRATPEPRRARVAGRLDSIHYSDKAFSLLLESGGRLRGVIADGSPEDLASLFGQEVVVSGLIRYRPSGIVLRIEAERIAAATDDDLSEWSEVPRPLGVSAETLSLRRKQGPRSGLAKIFGQWPGDETDDEINEFLADLS